MIAWTFTCLLWGCGAEPIFAPGNVVSAVVPLSPPSVQGQSQQLPIRRLWNTDGRASGRASVADDNTDAPRPLKNFSVRIVNPKQGEILAGRLEVVAEVNADRPDEVQSVDFLIDGRLLFSDAQVPYVLVWNAGPPAAHRIMARAYGPDGGFVEDVVHTRGLQPGIAGEVAFATRVDRVEVFVQVDARKGQLPQLGIDQFTVLEDGVRQSIVAVEQTRDLSLAIGLMVDCSGSMSKRLEDTVDAAGSFIDGLLTLAHDKAFVMSFSDLPIVLQEFTNDVARLEEALELVDQGRYTRLYDSIIDASLRFEGHDGRRALVLLTDGHDEGSDARLRDAIAAAQRADVVIYPVAVDLSPRFHFERWVMKQLAKSTGGQAGFLEAREDTARIYDAIADALRAQFRITYEPIRPAGDGEWREVEIRIDAALEDRVRLRTRPGYFAE